MSHYTHSVRFFPQCPRFSGRVRAMVYHNYDNSDGEVPVVCQTPTVLQNPRCGLSKIKHKTEL